MIGRFIFVTALLLTIAGCKGGEKKETQASILDTTAAQTRVNVGFVREKVKEMCKDSRWQMALKFLKKIKDELPDNMDIVRMTMETNYEYSLHLVVSYFDSRTIPSSLALVSLKEANHSIIENCNEILNSQYQPDSTIQFTYDVDFKDFKMWALEDSVDIGKLAFSDYNQLKESESIRMKMLKRYKGRIDMLAARIEEKMLQLELEAAKNNPKSR